MSKFTKGPWVLDSRNESLKGIDGYNVTLWGGGLSHGSRTDERVANAHLIAAAPSMYEMIERLIENYQVAASIADMEGYETRYMQDVELVKLLLSKARGES